MDGFREFEKLQGAFTPHDTQQAEALTGKITLVDAENLQHIYQIGSWQPWGAEGDSCIGWFFHTDRITRAKMSAQLEEQ